MKAALLLLTLLPIFTAASELDDLKAEVAALKAELTSTQVQLSIYKEAATKRLALADEAIAKAAEWKQEAHRLQRALSQQNAAAYYAAEDARRERMLAPTPRAGASSITIIQTADGHWQTSDGTQIIQTAPGHFLLTR